MTDPTLFEEFSKPDNVLPGDYSIVDGSHRITVRAIHGKGESSYVVLRTINKDEVRLIPMKYITAVVFAESVRNLARSILTSKDTNTLPEYRVDTEDYIVSCCAVLEEERSYVDLRTESSLKEAHSFHLGYTAALGLSENVQRLAETIRPPSNAPKAKGCERDYDGDCDRHPKILGTPLPSIPGKIVGYKVISSSDTTYDAIGRIQSSIVNESLRTFILVVSPITGIIIRAEVSKEDFKTHFAPAFTQAALDHDKNWLGAGGT
jgi:hypothetical protein